MTRAPGLGHPSWRTETRLVHDARARASSGVVGAIERSSTFRIDEATDAALAGWTGLGEVDVYGRFGTETTREAAAAVAALEGAEAGCAFGSGMAAISACLDAFAPAGATIWASDRLYGTTDAALAWAAEQRGVQIRRFCADDPDGLAGEREPAALVWCEAIANPTLEVAALPALAEQARRLGARLIVDATFAAGLATQPLRWGADVVVHSATKFLNGHSDVIAGVVVGAGSDVGRVFDQLVRAGGCLDPMAAWLLRRGLKTLGVRWRAQVAAARALAERLTAHPHVARVRYPGLGGPLPEHLADGGAMVAFELGAGSDPARFLGALELISHAVSLGGVETLVCVPARSSHARVAPARRAELGITDGLVRMSVGLEHVEDLWVDLLAAIAASRAG